MLIELRLLALAGLLLLWTVGIAVGWALQAFVDRRAQGRTVARVDALRPTRDDLERMVRNRQHAWRLRC